MNLFARAAAALSERIEMQRLRNPRASTQASTQVKVALRSLYAEHRRNASSGGSLPSPSETGFRVFSQTDEDGILLFLLAVAGTETRTFVDIGAGDGVHASNCANLAVNLGFHGLFIDADGKRIARGRRFYRRCPDTSLHPPVFVQATVDAENINALISGAGFEGELDVLSIDIDGNDYWIWEAIRCVCPRIVLVEAHVEFGMRNLVVPYKADFAWRKGMNPHYLGASPVALARLAGRLGYRLVAANVYGFNLFFVRDDVAPELIPAIEVEEALRHPRNRERERLFEQVKHLDFEAAP
jgi:hypothetical protein